VSSRPLVVIAATFLVLLAGCTEQTSGAPSATGSPTSASEQGSDETTTTTEDQGGGGGVADLKPCDILESSDLQALQLTGGDEKESNGARACRYRREGATLNDTLTVSVELFDELGLDDLNTDNIQKTTIGDHEAASWTDPLGACGMSIGVTDSSRIDNTAVGGENQQLACQLATQLATAVEKRLP
jgi:uncharacterized protein DUF3558